MTPPAHGLPSNYRFADLTLDVARRCVARQGQTIELKALDFDLLRFLVESAPNVVNGDVLAEKVWGRHFVSPENVAQRVMLLRQSLSDDANRPRYIETVRNKGYRLIPIVERSAVEERSRKPRRHLVAAAALLLAIGIVGVASLWRAEPAPAPPLALSVAVLPFENLSPDPSDASFAVGMQDEIVTQLTKIHGLRVIPVRTPAAGPLSPNVVRDLNVAATLGGNVSYSEGRVRVTPHLIEAATGVSLWSNRYERELNDIFAIQSEIALDVARELRFELTDSERRRIEHVMTADPRAHDLYVTARIRLQRFTAEETLRGVAEVEEALDRDQGFTDAWVLDTGLRINASYYEPEHAAEHRARAERAAERAVALDPESGGAHAALAAVRSMRKDWKGSEAAFRQARSLNMPAECLCTYALLKLFVGDFALARELVEESHAALPQGPNHIRFAIFASAGLGDWARATTLYESGMDLFKPWRQGPNNWMHWLVGHGELAAARALPLDDPFNAAMLASLDDRDNALAQVRQAYAAAGFGDPNHLRDIGLWAAHFGDAPLAFSAMRAAVDEQPSEMMYAWLPQLAPMRQLPEFKTYMREIGMVAYWEKYGWPPLCQPIDQHDFECH
jgi:TolB-like protein/DNA-binding winged helix-turn-helix (wHTH) protein